MAKLTVEIELDGAAFHPDPGPEVARILETLAAAFQIALVVAPRGEPIAVRDINGNTVGQVTIA